MNDADTVRALLDELRRFELLASIPAEERSDRALSVPVDVVANGEALLHRLQREEIEGCAIRAALVELAVAGDFHTVLELPAPRFVDALVKAWDLVDDDGMLRAQARMEAGCIDCGAELVVFGADLCATCVERRPA